MRFEPDLLVAAPSPSGRVFLVVETKLSLTPAELEEAASALRRYMVGMRCPTGLLATRECLGIYRDRYTDYTEESIEHVGDFPASEILTIHEAKDPLELERAVQAWLEGLVSPSARSKLLPSLRAAVEEYVLPALEQGEVRASGPRREHPTTS